MDLNMTFLTMAVSQR